MRRDDLIGSLLAGLTGGVVSMLVSHRPIAALVIALSVTVACLFGHAALVRR